MKVASSEKTDKNHHPKPAPEQEKKPAPNEPPHSIQEHPEDQNTG
jgi:hypothetical protein